jgi:hypothetical protein
VKREEEEIVIVIIIIIIIQTLGRQHLSKVSPRAVPAGNNSKFTHEKSIWYYNSSEVMKQRSQCTLTQCQYSLDLYTTPYASVLVTLCVPSRPLFESCRLIAQGN